MDNIDSIAAVDGVDVLFIGPVDLSRDLGIFGQLDHPLFLDAVHKTAEAARHAGKQAGIIVDGPAEFGKFWNSDTGSLLPARTAACSIVRRETWQSL